MAQTATAAKKHLEAGTITAAEKRHLLLVAAVKYYAKIRAATVSG